MTGIRRPANGSTASLVALPLIRGLLPGTLGEQPARGRASMRGNT